MCPHGSGIRERLTGSVSKLPQTFQHCAENPFDLWLGVVVVHLLSWRHAYSAHTPQPEKFVLSCIAVCSVAQNDACRPRCGPTVKPAKVYVPGTEYPAACHDSGACKQPPSAQPVRCRQWMQGERGFCKPEVGRKVLIVVIGRQVCGDLLVYEQRRLCSPASRYILLRVPSTCTA